MHYNFFADKNDKEIILDFIFKETDLQIYDHTSAFDEEVCQYFSVEEITSKFDLINGDKFAVTFNLWSPRHSGSILFRKINLDPKRCQGHTFRYSTNGWGLIQLYFGGQKNSELHQSHLGHFNKAGALKVENTNSIIGKVSEWDWNEIEASSRKLKYQIHNKLATKKIGSIGVLPGASELELQGIFFR